MILVHLAIGLGHLPYPFGYYAFFVPPSLYRVQASATGYISHTSPDIRVISEVVHNNIPLAGGTLSCFLPLIMK